MLAPSLLDHTRARFPDFQPEEIEVTPLEKGGSDRKFYRIDTGANRSLILVKYSDQREENRHYVEVAQFLTDHGLNAPQILHHDAVEGLIWMQDLGQVDLWSFRKEPWNTRKEYYQWAIEQLVRLHALSIGAAKDLGLQPAFDERLYRWEQGYFFENCLNRHFGLSSKMGGEKIFSSMAQDLAELPRVLVHRDFQSQNIMIRNDQAWLIDFQGMRPGLRQYDLASLLYDPYVDLTLAEKEEMLEYYQSLAEVGGTDFRPVFYRCAAQRLMQALGAYGFLGHVKGRVDFLRHTPRALALLKEVLEKIEGMDALRAVLEPLS